MGDASHVYNTHLVIDNNGDVRGVYRKTHLFDVEVPGGAVLRESDYIKPGTTIEPPVVTPVGRVGMAIVSFVFNYLTHILSLLLFCNPNKYYNNAVLSWLVSGLFYF